MLGIPAGSETATGVMLGAEKTPGPERGGLAEEFHQQALPAVAHSIPHAIVVPPGSTKLPGSALEKTPGDLETLSGRFIWISLWRAFRLQINTNEVLASERRILEADAQHIVDPEQQAFLAWRRSVLLVVAICFVPLTIVRFVEAFQGPPIPPMARMFVLFPAIAEALFCAVAFDQLKNWTRWKKQRRILFFAWALYMLAPFVAYLYPYRNLFEESIQAARRAAEIGGVKLSMKRSTIQIAVGLAFGVKALLVLGPKVISLMPGLIRASIVSKLLFPGMTSPGWLMMLAAPFYALFAYIIVLLPYQITGSWLFLVGNGGLLVAQIFIGWAGRILTEPLSQEEAHRRIQNSWKAYMTMMAISAGFMVLGLHDFISQLHLSNLRIVTSVLSFVSGVLLLTMIGTDGIVGGMAHFRKRAFPSPEREALLRASEEKLGRFCD